MFAAVREMNRLGLEIIGVYHSHPAAEPVPSEKDRRENFSPDVAMIIISLKHEPPLIRGWRVSAERTEAEIIIEEV
jgi:proteasome lid subunit RPN8/RPN11